MPDTLAEDVFGFESSGSVSAFFVVSVSGLTANPTHGETAQIAERLYASAHHFSDLAPASITWQWRCGRGDIAGATEAVYVPVPGDNLETIYPVATPLGPYAPQAGPAHVVRFAAPVASGALSDVNFSQGTGEQTIAAAGTFAGDYLTFSVETALPGVSIDRGTGVVTVSTGSEIDGDVAVIASNSGGAAEVLFNLSITSAATVPAQMPAPTVRATGQDSLRVDLAVASGDGGSPITSYDLRFRTGNEAWTVRKGVSDPEVLSGLLADTEYEVRTAAVNAIGRGPWSGSGSARTEKDVLPAIMANPDNTVDILVSDGTFTITVSGADLAHHNGTFGPFDTSALTSGPLMVANPVVSGDTSLDETLTAKPGLWIFPADDAATITGEWISGGVGSGDTATSYLTDLDDATNDVLYRETATNSAGTRSADSNAITLPTLSKAPAQMSAPTVTASGANSINVDLAVAPDDGGSAITSYDLRYSTDKSTWMLISDVSDPETVSGLTASTLYYVQTRAVNAVGAGTWSTSSSDTTDAAAPSDSFFEDWTDASYSINDEVDTLSNWVGLAGLMTFGGATASLLDNGGTTMLRADTANAGRRGFSYDGSAAIGSNRRVTVTLAQLGDTTFPNYALQIDLHYANDSEYIRLFVASDGQIGFRQKLAGTTDWDRLSQPVTDTSVIEFEHNDGNIICRLDGVQVGPIRTLTTPPSTWSQPGVSVSNGTTNTIIESINLETLP